MSTNICHVEKYNLIEYSGINYAHKLFIYNHYLS